MKEMDAQSKRFFGKNERFADLVNGSLYKGGQLIKADELEEMDTELNEQQKTRRRDLLKRCKKNGVVYAVIGAEMQSTVDRLMPVRVMEYDAMSYRKMMETDKKLYPLITLCLYTGENEWKQGKSLYEMMEIPERYKGKVQNYEVNVVEALNEDAYRYQNAEVREFFELFQDVHHLDRTELYEKYRKRSLQSVEAVETAAILGKCEVLKELIVEDEEGKKMCRNFDRIVEEWKDEGREEGLAQGHAEGRQAERLEMIKKLNQLGVSLEIIAEASGLNMQEARQMMVQMCSD